jgi:hypothetical protein
MSDLRHVGSVVPVDLLQTRCAIATLVQLVECGGALSRCLAKRADAAIGNLCALTENRSAGKLDGPIRRLLDPAEDPGGQRTLAAIDTLAALMRVDRYCASALAALTQVPTPSSAQVLDDGLDPVSKSTDS